jgi:L-fuconolactonase
MSESVVIDAHHHFWDPARAEYPFLTDELADIRRRFGPEDLRPLLDAVGVDRTVLVQTRSSLEETGEFMATAAATDFVAGVVGWVDLTDPAVGETLAALRERPDGTTLVGIRHQVHDEPDPGWLEREDVARGLRAVADAGLAYDLLVKPRELPAALATARAFPDLRLVIDHIAKPPIASGEIESWAALMTPFGELPHVFCKLSGMVTEADWERWTPDDLAPYVARVMETFGEDRVMFGSDWPVCLLAGSYQQIFAVLEQALEPLSVETRGKVFGGNAVRFYELTVDR